jgi:hypothetical protein
MTARYSQEGKNEGRVETTLRKILCLELHTDARTSHYCKRYLTRDVSQNSPGAFDLLLKYIPNFDKIIKKVSDWRHFYFQLRISTNVV